MNARFVASIIHQRDNAQKLVRESCWKGDASLLVDEYIWDDETSFAPVFLVADIRNDGTRTAQITAAYLDVAESHLDYQPYLSITGWGGADCGAGSYEPSMTFNNYGWGEVRDAKLVYSFGKNAQQFTVNLGTFDLEKKATVDDGIQKSGVDVGKLKRPFHCASKSQLPACLAKLRTAGIFGNLAAAAYLSFGGAHQGGARQSVDPFGRSAGPSALRFAERTAPPSFSRSSSLRILLDASSDKIAH